MVVPPPCHGPPEMADPAKAALRADLRARRDQYVFPLSADDRATQEAHAAAHLWPLIAEARSIAFYIAEGSEISCTPLIAFARAAGATILLPHVTARSAPMRFLRWDDGVLLETGWFGLRQPPADSAEIAPEAIVTPLLGFDSARWRIGQGAGFYDRAFSVHGQARRIGFAWAAQQVDHIPRDPWDERLEAIVTERGIIEGPDR